MPGCVPAISDQFVGKARFDRDVRPQPRLNPAKRVADGPHLQCPIDNTQQNRVAVGEPESAPDIGGHLQSTSAHQLASLCIHVPHPAIIQIWQ
jgi:hypothetical protein